MATYADVIRITKDWPGVTTGNWYGTADLRDLLDDCYRIKAPKKLVAERDAQT